MRASSAPTATVSPSGTMISSTTPLYGLGISESTLSVATSSRGSSKPTVSPTARSHLVTVPVVTVSPSFGILKTSAMAISPYVVATRRSVLMISGSCGTAASSSAGLVGIGVFLPAMRTTGPSSCQKHSSATVAAISAP